MLTIDEANNILINGDGVLVTHIDSNMQNVNLAGAMFDQLAKMAIIILVRSGSAETEIDYKSHHVNYKDNNIVIIGKFNKIGHIKINRDFSADCLILSRKFISRLIPYRTSEANGPQMMPITNVIAMRDKPALHLSSEEKELAMEMLDKVEENIYRTKAELRVQILYVSVVAFLMELMNIIIPKYIGTSKPKNDRKRDIIQDFSNLLYANYKKEHSVSFYADKLCISAQYLTKSTRTLLGVSASKVISDMIVTEAIVMLRTPKISIQQIAQELGFSDQSSFGKFFKKAHGVSPLNYRKKF